METYALAFAIVLAAFVLVRGLAGGRSSRSQSPVLLDEHLQAQSRTLERLAVQADERRRLEEESTQAVRDVQRLLAGSFSKGQVGENLLASTLGCLPPSMVVRDFRVGGKVCEFAVAMADGKLVPVDSKWSAFDLARALQDTKDPHEQAGLRKQAEAVVAGSVRELAQYIDPAVTLSFAVAAVPDAVYHCLKTAHAEAHDRSVVIVSYSTAVPYLLSLWQLHRTYANQIDDAELLAHLGEVHRSLKALDRQLEGRLSKAQRMIDNAVGEMRSYLGSARTALGTIERGESAGVKEAALPIEIPVALGSTNTAGVPRPGGFRSDG